MTLRDVVVAALRAAGIATGDGVAKDAAGDLAPPYTVLYLVGGTSDGPVADRNADRAPLLQIMAVGRSAGSAENVAAAARAVMLGTLAAPAGFVFAAAAFHEVSQGIRRDDDTTPPLFYAVDQYRYWLTPA